VCLNAHVVIMYIKDHECSSQGPTVHIFLSPGLSKIFGTVAFTVLIDCSENYTYLSPGPTTLPVSPGIIRVLFQR